MKRIEPPEYFFNSPFGASSVSLRLTMSLVTTVSAWRRDGVRKKPPPMLSNGEVGVLEAPVNTRLSSPDGQRKTESPKDVSAKVLPEVDGGCGGAASCLPVTRIVAQLSRSRPSPG